VRQTPTEEALLDGRLRPAPPSSLAIPSVVPPPVAIRYQAMPFAFASLYFAAAYVALPLLLTAYHRSGLYYQICPLVKCWRPLSECIRETDTCKRPVLDCLRECNDPASELRREARQRYEHVQHPDDPALCRYLCFDRISTKSAEGVLECFGGSGCLEPADPQYTDLCASVPDDRAVVPFDAFESRLEGEWVKLYTTGWDTWPCQRTEFAKVLPVVQEDEGNGLQQSPSDQSYWKMNLYWNNTDNSYQFHMHNRMFPGRQWQFWETTDAAVAAAEDTDDADDMLTLPVHQPRNSKATLKTRAYMWGTEAHENWYVLDYDDERQTLVVNYCAYTVNVRTFDSITMVLRKKTRRGGAGGVEDDEALEQRVRKLLEDRLGNSNNLVRIPECRQQLGGGGGHSEP